MSAVFQKGDKVSCDDEHYPTIGIISEIRMVRRDIQYKVNGNWYDLQQLTYINKQ